MEYFDLIKERYSVRKFDPKALTAVDLEKILDAGRLAPTAANRQPVAVCVVQEESALEKAKGACKFYQAPCLLIVGADTDASWKNSDYDGKDAGEIDASIITTHMMLAAADLGIGSLWLGWFDPAKIRDLCRIPESVSITAILALGYPAADAKPAGMHFKRKSLSDMVVYEKFTGR